MSKFIIKLMCSILLSTPFVVVSGQKGFDVLLVNIGVSEFEKAEYFLIFKSNFINLKRDGCWASMRLSDGISGISFINKNKLPTGVDVNISSRAWNGDKSSVMEIRKIMHQDDGLTESGEGYHGMYIIKPEGNKLTLMGLGANEDRKKGLSGISEKVTVTLDDKDPKKAA